MELGEGSPLTARQAEFLEVVQDLARRGEAVHYSEVAARLGVSRWTAYDVLSTLAQRGFLRVEREQRPEPSLVGRCRVLFRPALSTGATAGMAASAPASGDVRAELGDWWDDRLRRLQREIRERGIWPVLQELLGDLARVSRPAVFCSTVTLALLLALRAVVRGAQASSVLSSLLSWLAGAEAGLAVFAGALAGLLLQHGVPRDLHRQLVERLPAFEQEVSALGQQGKETLRHFTLSAIREVWGPELSSGPAR
ncbi:MAG: helix-turn-helix domain-containing protein [Firmicutes bacterium]|nr:helix-turn-helix domain-containing protein [Bacillota bacterium]